MRKTVFLAVLAAFSFMPFVPQAHASALTDVLKSEVQYGVTSDRISQILGYKKALEEGNTDVLITELVNATLVHSGKAATAVDIATAADPKQAVKGMVQDKVRQEVAKQLNNKLADYQDEMSLLNQLLNIQSMLNPQVAKSNETLTGAPENYKKVLNLKATAYGPGPLDNGKWDTLTYMGGTVKKGVAAVDPNVIPMGSKLWIEGYGEAIAEDQGSAIQGNRIDLAFNTRQEALDYGIHENVKVYILQ